MRVLRGCVLSVLLVVAFAAPALANPPNPPNLPPGFAFPPQSRPWGLSSEQQAQRWVRWGFEAPVATNPLLNQTCTSTQFPPFTFVPAAIDAGLQTDCTVRWGTTLLMSPGGVICTESAGDDATCPAEGFALIDAVSLTVDGRPVGDLSRFVVNSRPFVLNLPDDNLFDAPAGPSTTSFKGYMVAYAVLVPGDHTIVLSDHFAGDPTSLDITIHLHVTGPQH